MMFKRIMAALLTIAALFCLGYFLLPNDPETRVLIRLHPAPAPGARVYLLENGTFLGETNDAGLLGVEVRDTPDGPERGGVKLRVGAELELIVDGYCRHAEIHNVYRQ